MSDLNNCTFIGRCTRDAEMQVIGQKGTSLVKWAIANNTGFGQYENTNFINCQMWGKRGESIMQYLKKGKQIAVAGVFENKKWTGNDGVQHDSWTLTVEQVTLLADSSGGAPQVVKASVEEETVF